MQLTSRLKSKMITLTKFEKVRVLGERAQQISQGAPPLVDISGLDDALAIAEKELAEGVIPIIVRRLYPDGSYKEVHAGTSYQL